MRSTPSRAIRFAPARVAPGPEMLEGAAQSGGLLVGLQGGGPDARAVIAESRAVVAPMATHAGPLAFHARLERRILHFWRCRVETRDGDGRLLLEGRVTL